MRRTFSGDRRQPVVSLLELILHQPTPGDILGNTEAAAQLAFGIEFEFGLFKYPFDLAIDQQAMLNCIWFAIDGGFPHAVNEMAVVWVYAGEEGFVGERRAFGNAENPVILGRPGQLIVAYVQSPTADIAHALGANEVLLAVAQRHFRQHQMSDVVGGNDDATHFANFIGPRMNSPTQPVFRTVGLDPHFLIVTGRNSCQGFLVNPFPFFGNIRVNLVVIATNQVGQSAAVVGQPALAGCQVVHVAVKHRDAKRGMLDQRGQLPPAIDQCLLELKSLADVTQKMCVDRLAVACATRYRSLNGKFTAVAALPVQLAWGCRLVARLAGMIETLDLLGM